MKHRRKEHNYILILFFINLLFSSVNKTIIEDGPTKIVIEINIDAISEADLYPTSYIFQTSNLARV